jgi:hypothetical protein
LRLRSDRAGSGDGRVYLIVAVATDPAGNQGHACCTVVVPHDKSQAALDAVLEQAAAARDFCETNGTPPEGFSVVGESASN